jgi:hypothetical protein
MRVGHYDDYVKLDLLLFGLWIILLFVPTMEVLNLQV